MLMIDCTCSGAVGATMLSMQEVNVLGQILNSTWGASSTAASPRFSIKSTMQGEIIILTYTTITNIVMGIDPLDQVREQERESVEVLKDYVKGVEKAFKETAGRPLKLKEAGSEGSVEMISMSPHNPKRTAYYRRKASYKIGD
jgi:hypothetical protein